MTNTKKQVTTISEINLSYKQACDALLRHGKVLLERNLNGEMFSLEINISDDIFKTCVETFKKFGYSALYNETLPYQYLLAIDTQTAKTQSKENEIARIITCYALVKNIGNVKNKIYLPNHKAFASQIINYVMAKKEKKANVKISAKINEKIAEPKAEEKAKN